MPQSVSSGVLVWARLRSNCQAQCACVVCGVCYWCMVCGESRLLAAGVSNDKSSRCPPILHLFPHLQPAGPCRFGNEEVRKVVTGEACQYYKTLMGEGSRP